MTIFICALIALVASPATAQLAGWLGASVGADGEVTIQAEVDNMGHEPVPGDWIDIIIARSLHGTCSEPVAVSISSWEIPAPGSYFDFQWQEHIPSPNLHYRYEVMARDEGGALHSIYWPAVYPHDIVAWGEAVALRGRLTYAYGSFAIDICQEGCWYGWCDGFEPAACGISEKQAFLWWASGQVLDFYGIYMASGMPSICDYIFSRVEEHDGDCGPIPNHTMSWGDLKSSYR